VSCGSRRAGHPDQGRRRRAAIAGARPETGVDLLYGIGGTAEGAWISAAALKCVGRRHPGKLWPRNDEERQALIASGYDLDRVLLTDDLVQSDNVFVSATGSRPARSSAACATSTTADH